MRSRGEATPDKHARTRTQTTHTRERSGTSRVVRGWPVGRSGPGRGPYTVVTPHTMWISASQLVEFRRCDCCRGIRPSSDQIESRTDEPCARQTPRRAAVSTLTSVTVLVVSNKCRVRMAARRPALGARQGCSRRGACHVADSQALAVCRNAARTCFPRVLRSVGIRTAGADARRRAIGVQVCCCGSSSSRGTIFSTYRG